MKALEWDPKPENENTQMKGGPGFYCEDRIRMERNKHEPLIQVECSLERPTEEMVP
ncbi:21024_t:CDS:2 [Gigaspora rosea]|nr:21024_t:CDS:2 [Gigaspora rosea]